MHRRAAGHRTRDVVLLRKHCARLRAGARRKGKKIGTGTPARCIAPRLVTDAFPTTTRLGRPGARRVTRSYKPALRTVGLCSARENARRRVRRRREHVETAAKSGRAASESISTREERRPRGGEAHARRHRRKELIHARPSFPVVSSAAEGVKRHAAVPGQRDAARAPFPTSSPCATARFQPRVRNERAAHSGEPFHLATGVVQESRIAGRRELFSFQTEAITQCRCAKLPHSAPFAVI